MLSELEEFYPYVEMPHVAKNPERFKGSFQGGRVTATSNLELQLIKVSIEWTAASFQSRKEYIELQLDHLESPKHDVRRAAQGRLLYLLQGEGTLLIYRPDN